MRGLGYLLITVGFLAGSLVAVQTAENHVDKTWFFAAFLVGVVGVVLARVGAHRAARHGDAVQLNFDKLVQSLDSIVEKITALDNEKANVDTYAMHGRIDETFPDDLNIFVEGRESIGHLFGLKAYADVMNEFAAGERYLNRVWSASIDGYIDEVQEYLGRARTQFEQAQRALRGFRQKQGAPSAG